MKSEEDSVGQCLRVFFCLFVSLSERILHHRYKKNPNDSMKQGKKL